MSHCISLTSSGMKKWVAQKVCSSYNVKFKNKINQKRSQSVILVFAYLVVVHQNLTSWLYICCHWLHGATGSRMNNLTSHTTKKCPWQTNKIYDNHSKVSSFHRLTGLSTLYSVWQASRQKNQNTKLFLVLHVLMSQCIYFILFDNFPYKIVLFFYSKKRRLI